MTKISSSILILFWPLLICRCNSQKSEKEVFIPDHIRQLENLKVYSAVTQSPDTTYLIKENTFGSSDEIFIEGYILDAAIDSQDRVFIRTGSEMGAGGIYVFNPDGSFKERFSGYGRAPGEFESIRSIQVTKDSIYILYNQDQNKKVVKFHKIILVKRGGSY